MGASLKIKPNVSLSISNHALMRYVERFSNFDFTTLKLDYMITMGLPSLNYVSDGAFMAWVQNKIDYYAVKAEIITKLNAVLTEQELNLIVNDPKRKLIIVSDNMKFVISDRRVITIMKHYVYPKVEYPIAKAS